MGRLRHRLATETDRSAVMHIISLMSIEKPHVIEIKAETRTLEQNARMWAMLSDIAKQVAWYDVYYPADCWKDLFSAALNGQRTAPGLEGGIVSFGDRTSKMTKEEMSDLIEYMTSWGVEKGVKFTDSRYEGWD